MNAISGPFRTAGVLLAALLAASCADAPTPSQSTPRIPVALQVVSGDGQTGRVGEELPQALTVRLVDADGLPVPGQIVNFRVASGLGSVYAGANVTNSEGIARERWTLGNHVTLPQVLEARAVDNSTGERVLYGTFTARATPGVASIVTALNPNPAPVGAGLTLPDTFKARITDRFGNPAPGQTVTWTVTSGGGRVPTGTTGTSVADSAGIARMRWAVGTTAGPNTLTATVAGGGGDTFFATGIPRSPVRMHISPDGPIQVDALNVYIDLTAIGTDQYGNTQPMNVSWTPLNPQILSAPTAVSPTLRPYVVANGTARIRASFNAMVDTVTVQIRQVPVSVALNLGSRTSVRVGESFRPATIVRDRNQVLVADSISGLTFHSSNPSVASVNASGQVTGVSPGTFHLTAKTSNGLTSAAVQLSVYN